MENDLVFLKALAKIAEAVGAQQARLKALQDVQERLLENQKKLEEKFDAIKLVVLESYPERLAQRFDEQGETSAVQLQNLARQVEELQGRIDKLEADVDRRSFQDALTKLQPQKSVVHVSSKLLERL